MKTKNDVDTKLTEATNAIAALLMETVKAAIAQADIGAVNANPASPTRKTVTKATFKAPRAKTAAKAKAAKADGKAEMKPCPVTGILNTHRRFSYLMPEVRTAANLKKFKGWAKKQPTETAASSTTETAAS